MVALFEGGTNASSRVTFGTLLGCAVSNSSRQLLAHENASINFLARGSFSDKNSSSDE
jgi:hypothetical protein